MLCWWGGFTKQGYLKCSGYLQCGCGGGGGVLEIWATCSHFKANNPSEEMSRPLKHCDPNFNNQDTNLCTSCSKKRVRLRSKGAEKQTSAHALREAWQNPPSARV